MPANSLRPQGWWLLLAVLALALLGCLTFSASAVARPAPQYDSISSSKPPATPCGSLSFAPPVTYTISTRPRSATSGDFNRDSKIDLVVTDYSANSVSVLLGNGDGTFQQSVNYPVGVHPVTPAVGDFNQDGIPDLVVANYD